MMKKNFISRGLQSSKYGTWPWAKLLDENISLKFLLETRLKSESFGPLIGFVTFLVQN